MTAIGIDTDVLDIRGSYRPLKNIENLAAALRLAVGTMHLTAVESITASSLGIVMHLLSRYGVTEKYNQSSLEDRPSVLAAQVLEAWRQLRFGTGEHELRFRSAFAGLCKRGPVDVTDAMGGSEREHDAHVLVGVIRKVSPWPEFAQYFASCVFAHDMAIEKSFNTFFFSYLRMKLFDREVAYGDREKPFGTNTATLLVKQKHDRVKLTFRLRRCLHLREAVWEGLVRDRCGASFKLSSMTLTVPEVITVLESFNWVQSESVADLDLLAHKHYRSSSTGAAVNPVARKQRIEGYMSARA